LQKKETWDICVESRFEKEKLQKEMKRYGTMMMKKRILGIDFEWEDTWDWFLNKNEDIILHGTYFVFDIKYWWIK
jgi:hypothetical protein